MGYSQLIFRVYRQYCSELVLCINNIITLPLITHTHTPHQIYLLFLPTEDLSFLIFLLLNSIWTFVLSQSLFHKNIFAIATTQCKKNIIKDKKLLFDLEYP